MVYTKKKKDTCTEMIQKISERTNPPRCPDSRSVTIHLLSLCTVDVGTSILEGTYLTVRLKSRTTVTVTCPVVTFHFRLQLSRPSSDFLTHSDSVGSDLMLPNNEYTFDLWMTEVGAFVTQSKQYRQPVGVIIG